jgi:hypothetical protein
MLFFFSSRRGASVMQHLAALTALLSAVDACAAWSLAVGHSSPGPGCSTVVACHWLSPSPSTSWRRAARTCRGPAFPLAPLRLRGGQDSASQDSSVEVIASGETEVIGSGETEVEAEVCSAGHSANETGQRAVARPAGGEPGRGLGGEARELPKANSKAPGFKSAAHCRAHLRAILDRPGSKTYTPTSSLPAAALSS